MSISKQLSRQIVNAFKANFRQEDVAIPAALKQEQTSVVFPSLVDPADRQMLNDATASSPFADMAFPMPEPQQQAPALPPMLPPDTSPQAVTPAQQPQPQPEPQTGPAATPPPGPAAPAVNPQATPHPSPQSLSQHLLLE